MVTSPSACGWRTGRVQELIVAQTGHSAKTVTASVAAARESGDGMLVEPDDLEAWAMALEALTNDELVDTRGSLARALYERTYTSQEDVSRLTEIYAGAISTRATVQAR